MMNNTIDKLNTLNINELNTVWSFINSLSADFDAAGDSEKLDALLDTIMEHVEYREAEMEALHDMEEAERNKFF